MRLFFNITVLRNEIFLQSSPPTHIHLKSRIDQLKTFPLHSSNHVHVCIGTYTKQACNSTKTYFICAKNIYKYTRVRRIKGLIYTSGPL